MGGGCCRAEVPSVEQVVLVGVSLFVCMYVCKRMGGDWLEGFLSCVQTVTLCVKCVCVKCVCVCFLGMGGLQMSLSATWVTSGKRYSDPKRCTQKTIK